MVGGRFYKGRPQAAFAIRRGWNHCFRQPDGPVPHNPGIVKCGDENHPRIGHIFSVRFVPLLSHLLFRSLLGRICQKKKGGGSIPHYGFNFDMDDKGCLKPCLNQIRRTEKWRELRDWKIPASRHATIYFCVISRTSLSGLPFEDVENDELLKILKRFSRQYFTEIFGFALMGT